MTEFARDHELEAEEDRIKSDHEPDEEEEYPEEAETQGIDTTSEKGFPVEDENGDVWWEFGDLSESEEALLYLDNPPEHLQKRRRYG